MLSVSIAMTPDQPDFLISVNTPAKFTTPRAASMSIHASCSTTATPVRISVLV
ncbi:MAG: hypothetical protein H7343_11660 [Undibacterium sp.]|nr:hypothetical protein [Opitutaceae bacterium]